MLCFGILYIDRETLGTSILLLSPSVAKTLQLKSQDKTKMEIKSNHHILLYHMCSNQVRIVFSFAGLIKRASVRNIVSMTQK